MVMIHFASVSFGLNGISTFNSKKTDRTRFHLSILENARLGRSGLYAFSETFDRDRGTKKSK